MVDSVCSKNGDGHVVVPLPNSERAVRDGSLVRDSRGFVQANVLICEKCYMRFTLDEYIEMSKAGVKRDPYDPRGTVGHRLTTLLNALDECFPGLVKNERSDFTDHLYIEAIRDLQKLSKNLVSGLSYAKQTDAP